MAKEMVKLYLHVLNNRLYLLNELLTTSNNPNTLFTECHATATRLGLMIRKMSGPQKNGKCWDPWAALHLILAERPRKVLGGATFSQGFQMNPTSQYIFAHPDFNFTHLYYKHLQF